MFAVSVGPGEIALIVLVVILLFGATKLPQLARSLGASAKEFRKGIDEGIDEERWLEDVPMRVVIGADGRLVPKARRIE